MSSMANQPARSRSREREIVTIASLLSHHGLDVPRYVTLNGRVIFDGVVEQAGSYSHPDHGYVRKVPAHHFHGGDERSDVDAESSGAWWWLDDSNLAVDRVTMAIAFPGFVELPGDEDTPPGWVGVIDTGRGRFEVAVLHRKDHGLPRVVPLKPQSLGRPIGRRFVKSPHLFLTGNLCVAEQAEWNAETHTVADVVAWAAHWYASYTEWRMTTRWPVEGYSEAS